MNLSVVGVLSLVLAVPAVMGLAGGNIDANEVGVRVLLAVAVAVCAEVLLRRFVDAVRGPADQPALVEVAGGPSGGRQGDPPVA